MSDESYSLETKYEIWTDKTGECLEVGPDRDGLDLIELRMKDSKGVFERGMTLTDGQARCLLTALTKMLGK